MAERLSRDELIARARGGQRSPGHDERLRRLRALLPRTTLLVGRLEPERPAELGAARVAQDVPLSHDRDGRLGDVDTQFLEDGGRALVLVEVDPRVRDVV